MFACSWRVLLVMLNSEGRKFEKYVPRRIVAKLILLRNESFILTEKGIYSKSDDKVYTLRKLDLYTWSEYSFWIFRVEALEVPPPIAKEYFSFLPATMVYPSSIIGILNITAELSFHKPEVPISFTISPWSTRYLNVAKYLRNWKWSDPVFKFLSCIFPF